MAFEQESKHGIERLQEQMPSARLSSGFSLIEVLAALAILGLALLLGLGLLAQQRDVLARLEARREANRAVDAALEALRSGAIGLREGSRELPGLSAGRGAPDDLTVVVRVRPAERPDDLLRAEIEARYTVRGEPGRVRVETLFWRPGSSGGR